MMNKQRATEYFTSFNRVLEGLRATTSPSTPLLLDNAVRESVETLLGTMDSGNKVMLVGNGGSAGIAQHIQVDLCKAVGVRAMSFYDAPVLTAMSNDHSYEEAFEKLVRLWAEPGDVLFAISSSGQSANIIRAVETAKKMQARIITLSGFKTDNPLRRLGHLNFYAPSQLYGEVEMAHGVLAHCMTDHAAAMVADPALRTSAIGMRG